jgi:hypothetical protein
MKKLSILLLSITTLLLSVTSISAIAETYQLKQKISPTISNSVFAVASGDAPESTFVSGEPITLLGTHGLTQANYTMNTPYNSSYNAAGAFDGIGWGDYNDSEQLLSYIIFDGSSIMNGTNNTAFESYDGSFNIKLNESTSVNAVYFASVRSGSPNTTKYINMLPKNATISYSIDNGLNYIEHESIIVPHLQTSTVSIADTPNYMTDLKIEFLDHWGHGYINVDEVQFLAK